MGALSGMHGGAELSKEGGVPAGAGSGVCARQGQGVPAGAGSGVLCPAPPLPCCGSYIGISLQRACMYVHVCSLYSICSPTWRVSWQSVRRWSGCGSSS